MSQNVADPVVSKLSPYQRRAIKALLEGYNLGEAPPKAGVSRRTIERYLNDPDFRVALDKVTGAALGDVARRMIGSMDSAIGVMLTMATDEEMPASVRLRAATAIVDHGTRLFTYVEVARRLDALEKRFDEQLTAKN